jgi:hypothetical protein
LSHDKLCIGEYGFHFFIAFKFYLWLENLQDLYTTHVQANEVLLDSYHAVCTHS